MKIFICCSKHFYHKISPIKEELERLGHEITLPNSYDNPMKEEEIKKISREEHSKWKGEMIKLQDKKVQANDAVLVLNFEKNGQLNYVGGATFLEMYKAWALGKKLFLLNPIPDNILKDEIIGFSPTIINSDFSKVI